MFFYFLFMPRIAVGSNALDRRSVSGGLSSAFERSSTAADKRTVKFAERSVAHGPLIVKVRGREMET